MKLDRVLIAVGALLVAGPALAQTAQEIDELHQMHPIGATEAATAPMELSKATIGKLLPDYRVVFGAEARRVMEITDGVAYPTEEAVAVNDDATITYDWTNEGYVSSTDWNTLNSDDLIAEIKAATVEANKTRQAKSLPTLTVTGWRQQPRLDQTTHTVTWAIDAIDSSGRAVVNFEALKLGRYGFERIRWIVDPTKIGARNDFSIALSNFHFANGATYAEYVPGHDRAATYGIAALVIGLLGSKTGAGAGLMAGAALFLKKAGVLVIAAAAGVAGWLRRLFSRSQTRLSEGEQV